jgi:hypothetical protein
MILSLLPFFADAATTPNCDPSQEGASLFGIPHWWQYIHQGNKDVFGKCIPQVDFPQGVWAIGLAALDILLFVAGLVAVGSIIWAGFEYITTEGNSEKGVSARKGVVNSIVGLVIAIVAASLVSFVGNSLVSKP